MSFVEQVLVNPDDGQPFTLYQEEKTFLRRALTLTSDGRLPFPEMVFSAPKKSGKTGFAAMCALYVGVVLAGQFGEIYTIANDYEQSQSRVFAAIAKIIAASPKLRDSASVTANKITFRSTGTFIQACASDYSGFAGGNPNLTIADELWGFMSESARRLFDEAIPSPARKVSGRLTVTYAGFSGESDLLESLYKRAMQGRKIARDLRATKDGMLCYWTNAPRAPWQTRKWLNESRAALRPNQYLRLIENQWVTSESSFIELEWWDACCADAVVRPIVSQPTLPVWVGVDASVKRDSTAIVWCSFDSDARKVRLVGHKIFQPSPSDPLDFEQSVEKTLLDLKRRFRIMQVRFDPYQLVSVAQRLQRQGVPMVEFAQSVPNLTQASSNLYEVLKGQNLIAYSDDAIRLALSRSVALETSRGWRIAKEKQSYKIDVVVALAMAALGAVEGQAGAEPGPLAFVKLQAAKQKVSAGVPLAEAAIAVGVSEQQLTDWIERKPTAPQPRVAAPPVVGTVVAKPPRHFVQPPDPSVQRKTSPWAPTPERIN